MKAISKFSEKLRENLQVPALYVSCPHEKNSAEPIYNEVNHCSQTINEARLAVCGWFVICHESILHTTSITIHYSQVICIWKAKAGIIRKNFFSP